MKVIQTELQAINGEIELYIMADTHIGSAQFNLQLVNDLIAHILKKNNRYVIFNGDNFDCTFIDSKGNVYENEMTPDSALNFGCRLFKPLFDKNRVVCITGGNHDDDRSMRLIGISLIEQFAIRMNAGQLFSHDSVMLLAKIKNGVKGHKDSKVSYRVFINHGNNGGGGTMGSKANALEKMALLCPTADVYIHSHTHAPFTFKDNYVDVDEKKGIVKWKERLFVNSNAFMNYFNSYAEKKLIKPASQSIPVIRLKAVRYQDGGRSRTLDRTIKHMSCEI